MTEYRTIRELCDIVADCPHSTPKWTSDGKIVVRNNNIKNGYIDLSNPSYTDAENFEKRIKRAIPQYGDIIITREAPMGEVGMVPEDVECCLGQRMVLLRVNKKICDKYYFLYSLQTKYVQHQISWSEGTGTTVSNLRIPHLERIKIPYVSIEKQKKIAYIIRCIEEKIDINKKINKNLLEQLNQLYTEFSTRSDWSEMTIGDVAVKVAMGPFGSNIKVSTFVEYGVPIISGNHLRGYFLEEPSYNYITEEHAEKLKNSIVYPKDIIFTHAGNIGQVAMIPDGCEFPYYVLSQRQFYLRCNTELVVPEYVLLFFHSKKGQHELLSYANQTGVPSIAQPATNLKKIRLPIPSLDEQKDWLSVVAPLITMYQNNYQETKRLASLRDTLLPKLMSGGIDVSNIDL